MRTAWRVIVRTVFWSYDRGTWPYDIAVILIVIFVFLSPRKWYDDQPQVSPPIQQAQVQLVGEDAAARTKTYRVDVGLLMRPKRSPELEKETHEILRKNVEELRGITFQIVRIEPVRGADGSVVYYEVSVKR